MKAKKTRQSRATPTCIIYCRVSSYKQANGSSVSLEAQESISKRIAKSKGYRIKKVCKEVKSAYRSSMESLKEILTSNRNTYIILYDVSRFSRNFKNGLLMLQMALAKNNTLVFATEKLLINNSNKARKMSRFTDLLNQSERESAKIGERIRTAQQYLREQGKYAGGYIPYGYQVLKTNDVSTNNTLSEELSEQNIIAFIRLCRKKSISSDTLNSLMQAISPQIPFININCYDKDQETVLKTISTALTFTEIVDLLNEYSVKKRGNRWSTASVRSVKTDIRYRI
jgi:DNA invertase Pin-like site-specific DNA recombinase